MTIVADTGGLYAIYDSGDAHHPAVRDCLSPLDQRLVVPALVLAELDYLLARRLGESARAAVIANLLDTCEVATATHADVVRAAEVAAGYGDVGVGLTDASVMITALNHGTRELLTVDVRHFRAVRPIDSTRSGTYRLLPFDA